VSASAATIELLRRGPGTRTAGPCAVGLGWTVALASRPEGQSRPSQPAPAVLPSLDPADLADVKRSVEGDGDAYARLVRRHQGAIAAYMWRFTRNRTQWEELVEEVFVEAYLSLRSYGGRAPLAHWLRKIATRVGYRSWKKRARLRIESGVPLEPWDHIAAPEQADPRQAAEEVHALLARLAPRDRLVLTLFYLDERSVAEIAELTGWSRTMVKVQSYRARNRLKKLLETEP
jgi:RNA polymerase sigma-70 factor, ECF subfamily